MDAEHKRRIALNESRIRAMNEQVREVVDEFRGDAAELLDVMCECADATCEQMLSVPRPTYEQVRGNGAWFLVAPDHIVPDVEHAVQREGSFWIVEKVGETADIAEQAR
jgi:hypothetical protein